MNQASSSKEVSPVAIGKKALMFMTKCKLPPIPEAFEVWYRYFEDEDSTIRNSLESFVDDPTRIDINLIRSIHSQYCGQSTVATDEDLSRSLADELGGFRSIIEEQRTAGDAYADQLGAASQALENESAEEASQTVSKLASETALMRAELDRMQAKVIEAETRAVDLENKLLESQAAVMTDHLTGVGNRRMYESLIRRMVKSTNRDSDGEVPYLALIDCDKFKEVNDNFGHAVGDKVIQLIAKSIESTRPGASTTRLGGDEFAVFFRCRTRQAAEEFADRLRQACSRQPIIDKETGATLRRVTLSIGVARVRPHDDESTWPERADKLLYEAKNLGGDRSVIEK